MSVRLPRIYVINQSTLISNADVRRMTSVVNRHVRDEFCPLWGRMPQYVQYITSLDKAQPGSWILSVLDDSEEADTLGWHTSEEGENIYGRVFCRPSLEAGSTAFLGKYAVSSVLDHEVKEIIIDPFCMDWWDTYSGFQVSAEVCDPVEDGTFIVDGVTLSNFVLPAWRNVFSRPGQRLDYMSMCTKPFELRDGGYWIQRDDAGRESPRYGRSFPEWKIDTKFADTSRGARRGV